MSNNSIIKDIILSQKDFHLLPRDEDGYCVYGDDLILSNNGISILPNKLKVWGYLDCSYNQLRELPDDLDVNINLYCTNNQLEKLPSNMVVRNNIDCCFNKITVLPNGLNISGYLNCTNNQLTSIPEDLVVKNNLYCDYNNITTEIKCEIGGTIYMDDEQRIQYDRIVKLNKIKGLIDE